MTTKRTILAALTTAALLAIGAPANATDGTPPVSHDFQTEVYGSNKSGFAMIVNGALFKVFAPRRDALAACHGDQFCKDSTKAQYRRLVEARDARLVVGPQ